MAKTCNLPIKTWDCLVQETDYQRVTDSMYILTWDMHGKRKKYVRISLEVTKGTCFKG